jgi:hypothetical protein
MARDPVSHGIDSGVSDLATRVAAAKHQGRKAVLYFVPRATETRARRGLHISLEDANHRSTSKRAFSTRSRRTSAHFRRCLPVVFLLLPLLARPRGKRRRPFRGSAPSVSARSGVLLHVVGPREPRVGARPGGGYSRGAIGLPARRRRRRRIHTGSRVR